MFVLIAIKGARMVVQYLTMHHEIPHSPYCTDIIYRRAIGDDTCLLLFLYFHDSFSSKWVNELF